jgi:hypothetical protein
VSGLPIDVRGAHAHGVRAHFVGHHREAAAVLAGVRGVSPLANIDQYFCASGASLVRKKKALCRRFWDNRDE